MAGFADFGPDLIDLECFPLNLPRDMYRGASHFGKRPDKHRDDNRTAIESPAHRAANIQRP
ncbi:hypothetical protein QMO14_26820 [Variovorax sp. CAN2819]|uniref:hypothetical protein n=1 Tax=Variovorax sp. CAN15 TaxID=3046727 RepID=UPI0026495211|nr:hypothetical protein [Variovorax sp. CAN15]MDN6887202.1 hypothetical protein [Variovorax sp. CAN15]